MEHRFAALETRFTAMAARLSGIDGRHGGLEERMSAMLSLVVRIAERLDGNTPQSAAGLCLCHSLSSAAGVGNDRPMPALPEILRSDPAAGLLPGAYHHFDATEPGATGRCFLFSRRQRITVL
jgi:hypothetical protein